MGLTPARRGQGPHLREADDPLAALSRSPGWAWATCRRAGKIFPNLTVEENLKVPIERPGPWTIARVYELFPRLAERKANKGRQLSGGEQEMLVDRARAAAQPER